MRVVLKKIIATMLITLLLCGSTSQSTWAAEMSPAPETSVLTEIFGTENVVPPGTDATVNDGMPHGLIMMTQDDARYFSSTPVTTVQIYTINPETGEQKLWSEFRRPYPAVSLAYLGFSGQSSNQFSHDYKKMVVDRVNPDPNNPTDIQGYCRTGWIDENGEFFDINEKLNIEKNLTMDLARAVGFYGPEDTFVFVAPYIEKLDDGYMHRISAYYYTTEAEINQGIYHFAGTFDAINHQTREPHCRYTYSKDFLYSFNFVGPTRMVVPTAYAEPTRTIFLADYLALSGYSGFALFPIKGYTSIMYDTGNGNIIDYLPDRYHTDGKSEWGGVVSPDGTTVAYLTVPGTKGKISMEFVDISQFMASGLNPAMRGTPAKKEFADGPIKDAEWNAFDLICNGPSCTLLEWKP